MTFWQAETQLKRLADGEYYALSYQYGYHRTGTVDVQCGVYIHGQAWHVHQTFEAALDSMNAALHQTPETGISEAPTGDLDEPGGNT